MTTPTITGTAARCGADGPWGVRLQVPANPGDVVNVSTKAGQVYPRKLIAVFKQYDDAVVWQAEPVDGGDGGGGFQQPQVPSQPLQPAPVVGRHGRGPATEVHVDYRPGPPGPAVTEYSPSGTGPAGPTQLSGFMAAAFKAYSMAVATGWADEQACSLAISAAIAVQRGAVDDLAAPGAKEWTELTGAPAPALDAERHPGGTDDIPF